MEITLGQILAAAIPTAVAAMIGYFARRTLEAIERGIERVNGRLDELDTKLDDHNDRLARVETRLNALDSDVRDLKAEKPRSRR